MASRSDLQIQSQSAGLLASVFRGKEHSFFENRGVEEIA